MSDDKDKTARAAEIEEAIRKQDAEKAEAEKAKDDAENPGKKIDTVLEYLGKMGERMDAMEKRFDSLGGGDKGAKEELEERLDSARRMGSRDWLARDAQDRKDREELSDLQYRADSTFQALGMDAPNPMGGEKPADYRIRLLRRLQKHSPEFKEADLSAINDATVFRAIEDKIFADAMIEARNPTDIPVGRIEPRTTVDRATGIRITNFYGPHTIFRQMNRQRGRLTGAGFLTTRQGQ